ncbi:MAG: ABC transporter ATP-binding protein [Parvularculaceae bacterium]
MDDRARRDGSIASSAKISGAIHYGERDLTTLDDARCAGCGRDIAMIFQEPMTALNPLQTIGAQVAEVFRVHQGLSQRDAMPKAHDALARAGLPPENIPPTRYPHELSGGQRQRAMIAMATALNPKIIIADEPTTALDVTTQAEILDLLRGLAKDTGAALLLITHDLAAVSRVADRVAVIEDGKIVADETADEFYAHADSALARKYLPARLTRARRTMEQETVLEARDLACDYANARTSILSKPSSFRAVDAVTFEVKRGENLGLIGESGSGKSTIAKALLGLHPAAAGAIMIDGEFFPVKDKAAMRRLRRKIQIVFQDPYSSFNPRMRVRDIIAEPFHLFDAPVSDIDAKVGALLDSVGLSAADMQKYPHEFSGGQRQRIALARALATDPEIIVLDEATSALDIASRNRVLALLQSLSETRGVSFLFITHDLTVIRDFADRVLVMRDGRIVETGSVNDIFERPAHDYTKHLAAAAPVIRWRNNQEPNA